MSVHASNLDHLVTKIAGVRSDLSAHAIYDSVVSLQDIRLFMERHVYAVWDFMCLLKGLQRVVTCVDLAWVPVGKASTRRFVNEIVLEEESDVVNGTATGHFELYLCAMEEIGADTRPIRSFLESIGAGLSVEDALAEARAPASAAGFVRATFATLRSGRPHVVAASFTFGREDSIPLMFRGLLPIVERHAAETTTFRTYLDRHLQLDEEDHGPKAVEMVCDLCGEDAQRWEEAGVAAEQALRARLRFWDGILAEFGAVAAPSRLHETSLAA